MAKSRLFFPRDRRAGSVSVCAYVWLASRWLRTFSRERLCNSIKFSSARLTQWRNSASVTSGVAWRTAGPVACTIPSLAACPSVSIVPCHARRSRLSRDALPRPTPYRFSRRSLRLGCCAQKIHAARCNRPALIAWPPADTLRRRLQRHAGSTARSRRTAREVLVPDQPLHG